MPRAMSQSARLFVIAVCAAVLAACAAPGAGDDTAAVNVPLPPLHEAAKSGNVAEIKTLIKDGADVNARGRIGKDGKDMQWTPLHEAAFENHQLAVKALIEAGADVNAKSNHQLTPLHLAAHKGDVIVSILIKTGADIHAKAAGGYTPLHVAALVNAKAVTVLIQHGANVNARNKNDETPLFGADTSAVTALVEAGADINARGGVDEDGKKQHWTPLHQAANFGLIISRVTILIELGADVNAKDNKNRTPLDLAKAKRNNDDVIDALLKAGAVERKK